MLNTSNSVTFIAGASDKTIGCLSVVYSFQTVGGKIEETINGTLIEGWHSERKIVTVHFYTDLTLSEWFMTIFLPSKVKQLTIDSTTYDVVCLTDPVIFKHLKGNKCRADVTLKFAIKTVNSFESSFDESFDESFG